MDPEFIYHVSIMLLFPGLLLLLTGHLLRERKISHLILLIGWVLFGVFWLLQVPHFMEIGDSFNAIFCFLGFVLFLFFSFHEALNFKWDEYLYSLNYIAGVTAAGGLFYYLIEKIEPLAKGLIYVVAWKSVWVLNLFGLDLSLGEFSYDSVTNEIGLHILNLPNTDFNIAIILACTGIQSIAIFLGILLITKSNRKLWVPWTKRFLKKEIPKEVKASRIRNWLWESKKRQMQKVMNISDRGRFVRVFMYTIPLIYVLNIFRNVAIIYGSNYEVLGPDTFNIAHNYLSKFLSLVVLIVMLFIVFELLPECLEGIMGILDLTNRTRSGMVKNGFIASKEPHEQKTKQPENKEKKKRLKN